MIESWGRGIEKIATACHAGNCPVPAFKTDLGGLMLTFPEPVWLRSVAPEAASNAKQTGLATQETTQERILAHLRIHPKSTRKTLAEVISLSDDGVKYHLKLLSKNGKIHRVGSTKAGHWEVLD